MARKSSGHMSRVAELGCILCRELGALDSPAELHHVFDTAARSDFLVIPLCLYHHRGKNGFHGMGEREFNRTYKTTEANLLARTIEEVYGKA